MQRVEESGLVFYRNENWNNIAHGIFTRHGGVSQAQWSSLNVGGSNGDCPTAVAENHRRMYAAAHVAGENAVTTWLVHSVEIVTVDHKSNGKGALDKADGMLTDKPDTPLVMRFADCVPLLFHDPAKNVIGLAHAGWRGTVHGMAASMIKAMRRAYGSRPADIEVVIGPAISQKNYQVGEEVVDAVLACYGPDAGLIWRDPADDSAYLDLWSANQLDLQRQGVGNVKVLRNCTFDNCIDFYSHRAEQGSTGRFGVVISL